MLEKMAKIDGWAPGKAQNEKNKRKEVGQVATQPPGRRAQCSE